MSEETLEWLYTCPQGHQQTVRTTFSVGQILDVYDGVTLEATETLTVFLLYMSRRAALTATAIGAGISISGEVSKNI